MKSAELPPDEGEPGAELQQEARDVANERVLDVTLVGFLAQTQEIEVVRILEDGLCPCCVGVSQARGEVRDCGTPTYVKLALDVELERRARPSLGDSLRCVPAAELCRRELGEQQDGVEPRQLCSSLLV